MKKTIIIRNPTESTQNYILEYLLEKLGFNNYSVGLELKTSELGSNYIEYKYEIDFNNLSEKNIFILNKIELFCIRFNTYKTEIKKGGFFKRDEIIWIDKTREEIVNEVKDFIEELNKIEDFYSETNDGYLFFRRNDTNGRIDTNLTSLKKRIIRKIKIKKIINYDR